MKRCESHRVLVVAVWTTSMSRVVPTRRVRGALISWLRRMTTASQLLSRHLLLRSALTLTCARRRRLVSTQHRRDSTLLTRHARDVASWSAAQLQKPLSLLLVLSLARVLSAADVRQSRRQTRAQRTTTFDSRCCVFVLCSVCIHCARLAAVVFLLYATDGNVSRSVVFDQSRGQSKSAAVDGHFDDDGDDDDDEFGGGCRGAPARVSANARCENTIQACARDLREHCVCVRVCVRACLVAYCFVCGFVFCFCVG